MTFTLPPISTLTSAPTPLPFFNTNDGTYKLPPLDLTSVSKRMGDCWDKPRSTTRSTSSRASHSHSRGASLSSNFSVSDATESPSSEGSPALIPTRRLSASPSTSPSSPCAPPSIPLGTKPHSRRGSVCTKAGPTFKLIPQPMLDPSKRPIRSTDALVVFPTTAGISQASQKKAKLLVGKDIETYFELQALAKTDAAPPRAYAYKMIWERRESQTFTTAYTKATDGGSRRGSKLEGMEIDDC